jgi:hypothetical protein
MARAPKNSVAGEVELSPMEPADKQDFTQGRKALNPQATKAVMRGQNAPQYIAPGGGQVVEDWLGGGANLGGPEVTYGATGRPPIAAGDSNPEARAQRIANVFGDNRGAKSYQASVDAQPISMRPDFAPPGYNSDAIFEQLRAAHLAGLPPPEVQGPPDGRPNLPPRQQFKQFWGTPEGNRVGSGLREVYGPDTTPRQLIPGPNGPTGQDYWSNFWDRQPNAPVSQRWSPNNAHLMEPMTRSAPQAAMDMSRMAAPIEAGTAEAAATGGRVAGLARGAVGMMGGPALLGGLGVLNNAVDLSDENSVMRKAIHEGNYGTALARGAANFIPFAGTIWDNLAGNNHPNQPTVNKPQSQSGAVVMGPASNEDLVAAYDRAHAAQQPAAAPADPYNHGNYTSRAERVENFKLAHTYEDKPSVAAAKNQMQMLSRDLEAAKASGDRTRYAAAFKRYNDFERMLAMGAASYPYNARAVSESPEYEWTGAGGY